MLAVESSGVVSPIETTIQKELNIGYNQKNTDYPETANSQVVGKWVPLYPKGNSKVLRSTRKYDGENTGIAHRIYSIRKRKKRDKTTIKLFARKRRGRKILKGTAEFRKYSSLFR